jgi:hypothetical protein
MQDILPPTLCQLVTVLTTRSYNHFKFDLLLYHGKDFLKRSSRGLDTAESILAG